LDEGDNVGYYEGRGACETALGRVVYRAAPAALVERMDGDGARGEVAEENVIAVYMVVEAVEEDQLCFWGTFGLERKGFG
jgi:hypothetical protein